MHGIEVRKQSMAGSAPGSPEFDNQGFPGLWLGALNHVEVKVQETRLRQGGRIFLGCAALQEEGHGNHGGD